MTEQWKIYALNCAPTGKQYIGITKTKVQQRWRRHLNTAKRGSAVAIAGAIRKYGEAAFSLSVIATTDSFNHAAIIERAIIAVRSTMVPNGYNLTTGGEATMGRQVSDETRQRMSASAKARPARQVASAETRQRISVSRKKMLAENPHIIESIRRGRLKHGPDRITQLRDLWDRGYSVSRISAAVGLGYRNVCSLTRRHDFPMRRKSSRRSAP